MIGEFGGVHRGHIKTLQYAFRLACVSRSRIVVLIIQPQNNTAMDEVAEGLLLSGDEKARLLIDAGARGVVTLNVDDELVRMDAATFVKEIVVGRFEASGIVVEADLNLELAGSITAATLAATAPRKGVSLHVAPLDPDTEGLSVGGVVDCLATGDVARAGRLLGRHWLVEGVVVHGDKRGRVLGVPTANIELPLNTKLAHGVYAVRALVGRRVIDGVASFGTRPQFGDGAPLLEVHLLGFEEDIYGQNLRIEFIEQLREEILFPSVEALRQQMALDMRDAVACIDLHDRKVKSVLTHVFPLGISAVRL